jgi:hypothetical protein
MSWEEIEAAARIQVRFAFAHLCNVAVSGCFEPRRWMNSKYVLCEEPICHHISFNTRVLRRKSKVS